MTKRRQRDPKTEDLKRTGTWGQITFNTPLQLICRRE
jgi:hypothetical protein